jgi:branched-chain amino acid transport system ATP-binding protein
MLEIKELSAGYGHIEVLHKLSVQIVEPEIIALVGANGAGKTTLLKTISGLLRPTMGTITFMGEELNKIAPEKIVRLGIAHVQEGRQVFPNSTIKVNLEMGGYIRKDSKELLKSMQQYYEMFPILFERRNMPASLLSGGEQQMLVIARALMSNPKLLLLDEPSMGLAPNLVNEVFSIIEDIHSQGVAVFLVEQNVKKALQISKRGYVIETGSIALQGAAEELLDSDEVRKAYLGVV